MEEFKIIEDIEEMVQAYKISDAVAKIGYKMVTDIRMSGLDFDPRDVLGLFFSAVRKAIDEDKNEVD